MDNVTDACSPNCKELVYDNSVFDQTTITQWDLVCEREWLVDLSQLLVMVGILIGNILFGYLSDRYVALQSCLTRTISLNLTFLLYEFVSSQTIKLLSF